MSSFRTTRDLAVTPSPSPSKPRPLSASGTATLTTGHETVAPDWRDDSSQSDASTLAVLPRTPPTRDIEVSSRSGINWRFAHQGTGLVSIAADANADGDNEALERKAYLDGLTYLLRSLPSNLNSYEMDQIQAALPQGLSVPGGALLRSGTATQTTGPGVPKSVVHRLVQSLVLNIFLLVHLILPYLIVILKSAASVERKYKMSEAVVGHGMNCFNAVGRQCARVAEVALTANDGKASQGVSSTFAWTVEEVTRGISDGVGEGLHVTRFKDAL